MSRKTYFLGGNTAEGFYSCYDGFCSHEDDNFLWVIKGGPGCGKSSFMRRIGKAAEEKGLDVDYVLCSGDPDSLDGVYIPAKKIGYVDGTAPHVIDPKYPAISGLYLDLGQFYDKDALKNCADEIITINQRYKDLYADAYKLLAANAQGRNPAATKSRCCFLSAISCKGIVNLPAEPIFETELRLLLKSIGKDDIVILHPLFPGEIIGIWKDGIPCCTSHAMPDCSDAVVLLGKAKKLHDELESLYNPHVDFDKVYKLAQEHIEKYL